MNQETYITAEQIFEQWKSAFFLERGRKASQGMRERIQAGWCAGPAPLGYKNADTTNEMSIIVDKEKAPLINEAFQFLAKGYSLRRTLLEMTKRGLTNRDGRPLHFSSFQLMMKNPFYYGMLRYQGELYPGKHEPLISKELFEIAQRRLDWIRKNKESQSVFQG